jgi:hypothetical protein
MRDVNNFGEFVKKFDGAQTLLGQRAIPDPAAAPEAQKEFYSKLAPKTADEYKFSGVVEGVDSGYAAKVSSNKELRGILHAAGASPYQANIIMSGIIKQLNTAEQGDRVAKDAAYTKLSTELFGDQRDAITSNAKKFLATHVPANVLPLLEGMDEKQMTVLLAVTDGMAKKFTGEDPFRGGGAGAGGSGGETKEQLIGQMQMIQKDPTYSDPFKDRPKHAELMARMEVIRGKLKKLQAGT